MSVRRLLTLALVAALAASGCGGTRPLPSFQVPGLAGDQPMPAFVAELAALRPADAIDFHVNAAVGDDGAWSLAYRTAAVPTVLLDSYRELLARRGLAPFGGSHERFGAYRLAALTATGGVELTIEPLDLATARRYVTALVTAADAESPVTPSPAPSPGLPAGVKPLGRELLLSSLPTGFAIPAGTTPLDDPEATAAYRTSLAPAAAVEVASGALIARGFASEGETAAEGDVARTYVGGDADCAVTIFADATEAGADVHLAFLVGGDCGPAAWATLLP